MINFYCDESCHLEFDRADNMVLGAVWCRASMVRSVSLRIRDIKEKHNYNGEIKWTKICNSNVVFYKELVNYFFSESALFFRGIIANKTTLEHDKFNQSHDDWYYKMYYQMLQPILKNNSTIYLDIKDTRSQDKINKLRDIINGSHKTEGYVAKIQHVRSVEVVLVQLCDVLIGVLSHFNNKIGTSEATLIFSQQILPGLILIFSATL